MDGWMDGWMDDLHYILFSNMSYFNLDLQIRANKDNSKIIFLI